VPPVRLIHIAPELPPTVGGIADYTAILSRRLVEVSNGTVEPVLVRAGKASDNSPDVDFRCVNHDGSYSAEALSATIEQLANEAKGPTVALLQYSGYGYAPRGAPLWLLRALQQACGEKGVPLITMFHELYATGPPWTSAFWLSPVQRYVAAQLARLSSAVVTNRAKSTTWLRRYVPAETPVRVQPVFSNVGEPEHVPGWDEREPYAVVFGGRSMKRRLYDALQPAHLSMMLDLGIHRIVDVGSPGAAPERIHGTAVEERGIQPAESISALLSEARAGLLHYPVDYLTKSGIWSGYVAHGLPTLVFSDEHPTEVVKNGVHYIRVDDGLPYVSKELLRKIGQVASSWYRDYAHSGKGGEAIYEYICTVAFQNHSK